jgi:hypothetical protein
MSRSRLPAPAAKPTIAEEGRDRARLVDAVARRGLTSVMNDTRWDRLQQLIRNLPFPPPYQYKSVLMEEPYPPSFDEDVAYLGGELCEIGPFDEIEWIRFRPRYLRHRGRLIEPDIVDCADAFRAALTEARIPFEERDESIWVFGYVGVGRE